MENQDQDLEGPLSPFGLSPSISAEKLNAWRYRDLKIGSCQFSENRIQVVVNLPVYHETDDWRFYEIIRNPFQYNGQKCVLKNDGVEQFAHGNNQVVALKENDCMIVDSFMNEKICNVSLTKKPTAGSSYDCVVRSIMENLSKKELLKICPLSCT